MGAPIAKEPEVKKAKTIRPDGILTVKELHEKLTKIMADNPERAGWPVLTYSTGAEEGDAAKAVIHESKNGIKLYNKADHPFEFVNEDWNAITIAGDFRFNKDIEKNQL